MKKLFLLLITAVFFSSAFGQNIIIDSITVDCSTVVAADTIIAFPEEQLMSEFAISVEFSTLDADDASFDIVVANQRGNWLKVTHSTLPYTLDATTLTDTLTNKAGVAFITNEIGALPFPFCGIRLYIGSVTDGDLYFKRTMITKVKRRYP